MKPIIRSSLAGAALALGLAAGPLALGGAVLVAPGAAYARSAPSIADMKATLADYGEFVTIEKYGEVWKPTVTPRGWHPYPACDWVYTKDYGWYFSDKTAWGSIVHHYGRWLHDETQGWLWVPGAEFSPGWVVWRTSDDWIGWAPTPPDVDATPAKMAAFDDDKLWTFMDARKFGATCEPGVRTVATSGDVWKSTAYVTDIRFYDGIAIFVLPPAIVGPVVDVDIDVFAPWSPTFIGTWIGNWTGIFTDIDVKIVVDGKTCGKDPKDPRDPQSPGGPKPFKANVPDTAQDPRPSKIRDDGPPPAPGGFRDRAPRRAAIDRGPGQGRARPPKREIRTFEPEPDDVAVEDRGPNLRRPKDRLPGERERGDRGEAPWIVKLRDPRRERGPAAWRDREPEGDRRAPGRAVQDRVVRDRVAQDGRRPGRALDKAQVERGRFVETFRSDRGGASRRRPAGETFEIR